MSNGYLINYLRPINSEVHATDDYDVPPLDLDFKKGLVVGLASRYDNLLGLRVQKRFFLTKSNPAILPQFNDIGQLEEVIERLTILPDSNLGLDVVREVYDYELDEKSGLPTRQGKQIYFVRLDGTIDQEPNKVLTGDIFDPSKANRILTGRREEVVNYLKARASQLELKDAIEGFFGGYFEENQRYQAYGNPEIIAKIRNDEREWLGDPVPLDVGLATLSGQEFDPDNPPMTTVRNAIAGAMEAALVFPSSEQIQQYLGAIA